MKGRGKSGSTQICWLSASLWSAWGANSGKEMISVSSGICIWSQPKGSKGWKLPIMTRLAQTLKQLVTIHTCALSNDCHHRTAQHGIGDSLETHSSWVAVTACQDSRLALARIEDTPNARRRKQPLSDGRAGNLGGKPGSRLPSTQDIQTGEVSANEDRPS